MTLEERAKLIIARLKCSWERKGCKPKRSPLTGELELPRHPEEALEDDRIKLIADQAKALKEQDDWLIEMANDNTVDNMKMKAEQALKKANERVEELEKAIACATIISWRVEDLPEDKNRIMMIASDKIVKNLKHVYPMTYPVSSEQALQDKQE